MRRQLGAGCRTRTRRRAGWLGALLAATVTGCLPITWTSPGSPPVAGVVTWTDGSPAAGIEMAVTSDWRDDRCSRAARRTTTDGAGRFSLSATDIHHRWVLLLPYDPIRVTHYWLCAGPSDSALRIAFEGSARYDEWRAKVSCRAWDWRGQPHATCSDSVHARSQLEIDGGRWSLADTVGSYRLIVTDEARSVSGRRRPEVRPTVYVQWIEELENDRVQRVHAIAALSLDPSTGPFGEVSLEEIPTGGSWCAVVRGRKPQSFALGPPGEARPAGAYCADHQRH